MHCVWMDGIGICFREGLNEMKWETAPQDIPNVALPADIPHQMTTACPHIPHTHGVHTEHVPGHGWESHLLTSLPHPGNLSWGSGTVHCSVCIAGVVNKATLCLRSRPQCKSLAVCHTQRHGAIVSRRMSRAGGVGVKEKTACVRNRILLTSISAVKHQAACQAMLASILRFFLLLFPIGNGRFDRILS